MVREIDELGEGLTLYLKQQKEFFRISSLLAESCG